MSSPFADYPAYVCSKCASAKCKDCESMKEYVTMLYSEYKRLYLKVKEMEEKEEMKKVESEINQVDNNV
jgi:hypothetical protein